MIKPMTASMTEIGMNFKTVVWALGLSLSSLGAWAGGGSSGDAVEALKAFGREVHAARASFVQVVTAPDGSKKKSSAGTFEFQRPNRFRFDYTRPYEQLIVADGKQVWLFDADLNQVTVRAFDTALGATPAAVLAGSGIERDFTLQAEPDQDGVQWVRATPKVSEGSIRNLRIGFKAGALVAMDIADAFGQHSRLDFSRVETNPTLSPQRFQWTPPKGVDVLKQ
jgi:outer membrane lipoprotein carrier protein